MGKKDSQTKQILQHLQIGLPLTPLLALDMFGCFRLSARIHDIKKQGYNVETGTRRLSSGKVVAKYWIP